MTMRKVNNGQNKISKTVNKDSSSGHNVLAGNKEGARKQHHKKPRKYRLMKDIYNDPTSHCRITDVGDPVEMEVAMLLASRFNEEKHIQGLKEFKELIGS
ncbi:hypothetical protein HanRHA438_Chr10g0472641 [Helianthus annuus]|nr:hypothetical protein HanRHA438_Chr10g0472641 [Helianthus annuus]